MELGNWSIKNQLGSTNSKGLPVLFQGSHQGLHLNNQLIHYDRSHGHAHGPILLVNTPSPKARLHLPSSSKATSTPPVVLTMSQLSCRLIDPSPSAIPAEPIIHLPPTQIASRVHRNPQHSPLLAPQANQAEPEHPVKMILMSNRKNATGMAERLRSVLHQPYSHHRYTRPTSCTVSCPTSLKKRRLATGGTIVASGNQGGCPSSGWEDRPSQ